MNSVSVLLTATFFGTFLASVIFGSFVIGAFVGHWMGVLIAEVVYLAGLLLVTRRMFR